MSVLGCGVVKGGEGDRWDGGGKVEELPDSCGRCRDLHTSNNISDLKTSTTKFSTTLLLLCTGLLIRRLLLLINDSEALHLNHTHWPMIKIEGLS